MAVISSESEMGDDWILRDRAPHQNEGIPKSLHHNPPFRIWWIYFSFFPKHRTLDWNCTPLDRANIQ